MSEEWHFKRGVEKDGWVPIYLVDENGNLLNTEIVCTVHVGFHPWFPEWLEKQSPLKVPE